MKISLRKLKDILYFTAISARPITYFRIAGEVLLGFSSARIVSGESIARLLLGFIIVGPVLWSFAYILNDLTDIQFDILHGLKQKRPIANGLFKKSDALVVAVILFSTSVVFASLLGTLFLGGIIILALSQILYTVEPFRLKTKAPFDVLLNVINALIRFSLGYYLARMSIVGLPFSFLFFAVAIKACLFLGHRFQSRSFELKNNFKSTVVLLTEQNIILLITIVFAGAIVSYFHYMFSVVNSIFLAFIPFFVVGVGVLMTVGMNLRKYFFSIEKTSRGRSYIYVLYFFFALAVFLILNYSHKLLRF